MKHLPIDTLHHVTIVTRDARETARQHAIYYDIPEWTVVDYAEGSLLRTSIQGRGRSTAKVPKAQGAAQPGEFGFLSAKGTSRSGGITFEIIQTTNGLSSFEHFLITRGKGVHSMCFTVIAPDQLGELRAFLADSGIGLAMRYAINDAADFLYFDTRDALGGFYLQVIVAHRPDWEATLPVREVWNFEQDIPKDAGALPTHRIQGLGHFGVVVHDLEKHLGNYAKLFGQPHWRAMNWETSDWLLEGTHNNGQLVSHGYYCGRANITKNRSGAPVGFEVIQPTWGPSHYKEDFLQVLGPGIHHLDLTYPVTDWDEWEKLVEWNEKDFSAATCMGGWLRGRSHYYHYQDTRKGLGYVSEIHAPTPVDPPRPGNAPPLSSVWYDFDTKSAV